MRDLQCMTIFKCKGEKEESVEHIMTCVHLAASRELANGVL